MSFYDGGKKITNIDLQLAISFRKSFEVFEGRCLKLEFGRPK